MPSDLHVHTTFSDGRLSPEEIVAAAKKAGLTYIAISDHVQLITGVAGIPYLRWPSRIGVGSDQADR